MRIGFLVRSVHALMCALTFVGHAAGADAPGDPQAAEALFAEAQVLMERGDFTTACPKLEESYRLDPATGALFALALCHEQQGRLASAWVEFMDVASRANAENYSEREQEARRRADALHPRLSFLTVRVDAMTAALTGLVISRNGVALRPAAWGTAIPIDPGTHVVEAIAPGYEPWRGTIAIGAEPQRDVVAVPQLRQRPVSLRHDAAKPPRASPFVFTPLRVTGIALGGAAIGALGVSAYSSVRALDKLGDSNDGCNANDVCSVAGDRDRTSAKEAANVATISAVAGGVLLASGVVIYFLGSPGGDTATLEASVSARGFDLRGSF